MDIKQKELHCPTLIFDSDNISIAFFSNNIAVTNLFEDLGLSTFFAQKHLRRKKGDLHFASKCIIFALQERRCYPDR